MAAAVVVAMLGAPTSASGLDAPRSLDAARDELESATRQLSDVERQVRRAKDEVAALDLRLGDATTELERVDALLLDAEVSLAAANEREREAAEHLARAQADLAAVLDEWESHRGRLADRLVHTFKHGSASHQQLAVRSVMGAGDWHEVAVALELADRLATDDRALVADARETTHTSAELRAEASGARREALDAARTAGERRRRVAGLLERQERIVAEVDEQRTRRREVLASLETDAAARAVLVRDLERRVAELELDAVNVFVPVVVDLDAHGPPPVWASRLPADGRPYAAAIEAISARHGLDGRLLAAVVWTESAFRPGAVSPAGALGLAQLMPGTARGLGVDPRDPLQNLDGGARYLRRQLERFGRIDLGLAAYNAGPDRVDQAGGVPDIVETQLYVVRVLERYEQLTD